MTRNIPKSLAFLLIPALVTLSLAGAAFAGPISQHLGATTLRIVGPANGTSTAAAFVAGACYLVAVENERSCFCAGQTTCAETAAKDAICLSPGAGLYYQSPGALDVAVISQGATGVVWFVPVRCQ